MADNQGVPYLTSGARSTSNILVYKRYKYEKNKKRGLTVYWRCHRPECRTTLSTYAYDEATDKPNIRIKVQPGPHTHDQEDKTLNREHFKAETIRLLHEDCGRPVKATYTTAVRKLGIAEGDLTELKTYPQMKRGLYRARAQSMPHPPKNLEEVDIQPPHSLTWTKERFFLHKYTEGKVGFLLFATDADLEILQLCEELFMDATHRTCPKPYHQYFSIHGNHRGRVVLLVSVLMTSKYIKYI